MATNRPRADSCILPRQLAPADVAPMEAVGEVDLVDRAVGARPRVGKSVGNGGYGEDPATFCDQALGAERRSGVEDGHALDLFGRFDLADQTAARRCAGISPRRDD